MVTAVGRSSRVWGPLSRSSGVTAHTRLGGQRYQAAGLGLLGPCSPPPLTCKDPRPVPHDQTPAHPWTDLAALQATSPVSFCLCHVSIAVKATQHAAILK